MQGQLSGSPLKRALVLGAVSTAGVFGWSQAADAATVLVNFGVRFGTNNNDVDSNGKQFNTVLSSRTGAAFAQTTPAGTATALVDSTNAASGISLTITNPPGQAFQQGFDDTNNIGPSAANPPTGQAAALGYTAATTNFESFGNTGTFNNIVDPVTRLVLSGLSPLQTYGFNLFGSRTGVTDNRDTLYTITGGTLGTGTTALVEPAANNTSAVATASGFRPDVNGNITIDVTAASTNTNTAGLYYLGLLQINTTAVPEPTSVGLAGLAAAALAGRRRRRV